MHVWIANKIDFDSFLCLIRFGWFSLCLFFFFCTHFTLTVLNCAVSFPLCNAKKNAVQSGFFMTWCGWVGIVEVSVTTCPILYLKQSQHFKACIHPITFSGTANCLSCHFMSSNVIFVHLQSHGIKGESFLAVLETESASKWSCLFFFPDGHGLPRHLELSAQHLTFIVFQKEQSSWLNFHHRKLSVKS